MTQYRVRYRLHGSENIHTSGNGPYDYRSNALRERNKQFKFSEVAECWIEKDGVKTGRVLGMRDK